MSIRHETTERKISGYGLGHVQVQLSFGPVGLVPSRINRHRQVRGGRSSTDCG